MMINKIIILVYLTLCVTFTFVLCQRDDKVSFTYLIDATRSMQPEIDAVKVGAKRIFESVISSNSSMIANYVLVIFRDPETEVITVTSDKTTLINGIDSITLKGNWDCPEMCMAGIMKALELSLPGSFIYVFTDANAKDYLEMEKVKVMANKKKCQITFVLTRSCGDENAPSYQAYYTLASLTNGQAFRMDKTNIDQIINYAVEAVKGRRTVIDTKHFTPGEHKFNITLDGAMHNLLLSQTCDKPHLSLKGPDGNVTTLQEISKLPKVQVQKLNDFKPGDYEVTASGASNITIVVTAATSLDFQHGFSLSVPTCIKSTSTLPLPKGKTYLSIQLITDGEVTLNAIQLLDFYTDAMIADLPIKVRKTEHNFYVTELFEPPNDLFKIAIKVFDKKSNSTIVRVSPTPIEKQNVDMITAENKKPTIVIDLGAKVKVEYDEPLVITCQVKAYPEPNITWVDELGKVLNDHVELIDYPYDYNNILRISNANKNETYTCKAKNTLDESLEKVQVEVGRQFYLDVIQKPSDISVEFKKHANITCTVNAKPVATLLWLKDGNILDKEDHSVEISSAQQSSTLFIKEMMPFMEGHYTCRATNDHETADLNFQINIIGTAPTVTIEGAPKIEVDYNKPKHLVCKVKGYPEPTIIGRNENTNKTLKTAAATAEAPYDYAEYIILGVVTTNATYTCTATNDFGEMTSSISVETFKKTYFDIIETPKDQAIKYEESGQFFCKVDANPPADIIWYSDIGEISSDDRFQISSDGSVFTVINMQPELVGPYLCAATNDENLEQFNFNIDITGLEMPLIEKTNKRKHLVAQEGSSIDIVCKILKGKPTPTITWSFKPFHDKTYKNLNQSGEVWQFAEVRNENAGIYRCIAVNIEGSAKIDIDLNVLSPPTAKIVQNEKYYYEGQRYKLDCNVTGEPTPNVIWYFNEEPMIFYRNFIYNFEKSIEFTASTETNGVITCSASNILDTSNSSINIRYTERVTLVLQEDNSFVKKIGENQDLKCIATGYPLPDINWWFCYKFNCEHKKLIRTSTAPDTLVLTSIQTEDEGLYYCYTNNTEYIKALEYNVTVRSTPKILTVPEITNAVEGDPFIRLPCEAEGAPRPEIVWQRNGMAIATGTAYVLIDDGSLIINDFVKAMSGIYTCIATNYLGKDSREFEVKAGDIPITVPEVIIKEIGEAVNLECDIAHTKLDTVKWYKNKTLLTTGDLHITVEESAIGLYICRVCFLNDFHCETKSKFLYVAY